MSDAIFALLAKCQDMLWFIECVKLDVQIRPVFADSVTYMHVWCLLISSIHSYNTKWFIILKITIKDDWSNGVFDCYIREYQSNF